MQWTQPTKIVGSHSHLAAQLWTVDTEKTFAKAQAEFCFTPQQTWQLVSVEKAVTKCLED